MYGHKKAKGYVSGNSPEEKITTWFTKFQKQQGEPSTVKDKDEEIPVSIKTSMNSDKLSPLSKLVMLQGQITSP
jgi:hypothetical protein